MFFGRGKKAYRKRKKPKYRYVFFAIVFMTVTIILGMSVFFKIQTIEITGSSRYTKEEILAASGRQIGDNLMLTRSSAVAAGIKEQLPYIAVAEVTKVWPSTLVISVEADPFAAIIEKESGGYYRIGSGGKILEELSEKPQTGQTEIIGLMADGEKSKTGSTFVAAGDDKVVYRYTLDIIEAIVENNLQGSIAWLDVTEPGNIKLSCNGIYTVEIGTGEHIDDKLAVLVKMLETLGNEQSGRIILKDHNNASFVPAQ